MADLSPAVKVFGNWGRTRARGALDLLPPHVGDLDKSCFAFLSVPLCYQSYKTVFCSSAGLSYHFFVCVRCMYQIEKKNHCILCSKTTCLEEVKAETNKSKQTIVLFQL